MAQYIPRRQVRPDDVPFYLDGLGFSEPRQRASITREQNLLLDHPHVSMVVDEEGRRRPVGLLICVFTSGEFYRECASASEPYIARRLYDWQQSGRAALLTRESIATANAGEGLNLLAVSFGMWPENPEDRGAVYHRLMAAFGEEHAGYNLQRIFAEPVVPLFRDHLEAQGYQEVNSYRAWHRRHGTRGTPALMAIDRSRALAGHDFFLAQMFDHSPPRCRFTAREQELLHEACWGGTDQEIAKRLSVSRGTVKQRWTGIYRKVEEAEPAFYSTTTPARDGKRGPERRQATIDFVRSHKEELRPYVLSPASGRRR